MDCISSRLDQRRVLLIDPDTSRQKLRATALRNFDVEVHITGSTREAEFLCTVNSYDLVLLSGEHTHDASLFSQEVRKLRPRQRVAMLVGAPKFVQELGGALVPVRPASTARPPAPPMPEFSPSQWSAIVRQLMATST